MTDPAAEPERIMRDVTAEVIDADYEVLPRHFTRQDFAPPPARMISMPSIEGMDMLRKPKPPSNGRCGCMVGRSSGLSASVPSLPPSGFRAAMRWFVRAAPENQQVTR
ncbi:hypothetical protein NKH49_23065 [Mesorhizobium sp. M1088]